MWLEIGQNLLALQGMQDSLHLQHPPSPQPGFLYNEKAELHKGKGC